ncbi:MAG: HAD-IIIA family hydrolase [Candidatus Omnitrophica bacterium]|nr:HAD-IIIA family hydrolase [Candidatus Omnitrophota bacterium]MBU1997475.1 HAD-IIIA family hydrolase [Candidatus Omnitrophota bacterium]MBU4333048.1 HAD-IIIA family hydrolase [Candidatus Omnitrophota bacterium]
MKIVFLDRDGVINEFPGNGNYVTKVKDFHFIPGSLEAIKTLSDNGYNIFVVSNQAGVGKGVYTEKKLKHITRNMLKGVKAYGGKIIKVYYCTHRSDAGCKCRKPEITSIKKAVKSLGKTLKSVQSNFFIGDTKSDILTGYNAGCKTILALSGRAKRSDVNSWGVKPDFITKNLASAVKIVIENPAPDEDLVDSNLTFLEENVLALSSDNGKMIMVKKESLII